MADPSIALATCADVPELDEDDQLLIPALEATGASVDVVVWDDPGVRWKQYDAVVIRSTWDYAEKHDEFVEWLDRAAKASLVMNPSKLIAWNMDKGYLGVLGAGGVPTVPTRYVQPGGYLRLPTNGEFVIKPTVSAGSRDTARYDAKSDGMAAVGHAQGILDSGRTVMIQPYLESVDIRGETALVFLDGEFSHAVRKEALLELSGAPTEELFAPEDISPASASDAELEVAQTTLEAMPTSLGVPVYARVDLLHTSQGPVLLELEMAEPSLFLRHEESAAARFAAAIQRRIADGE
ncbi:ATP-grasp domain-containing protein [Euzebya tangerina]|uniref:ATP-grasp domain-containing protein n=1 Tax=Euzebya tangerina TaxID=591198 RepID=UPI000E3148B5|nr:hypothetical protein [Euzebya tangerina]